MKRWFFIWLSLSALSLQAQIYYRVECEVSIKEIREDGKQQLMVGKVYFDKYIREIIYDIRFPSSMRFAVTDFGVVSDSTKVGMDKQFTQHLVDFSVFNLVLSGKLNYFGLDNTQYQLSNVNKEGDMVISEWSLPEEMGSDFGKMLVSQKGNQLYGMVSLDVEGNVVSKQFFTEYQKVQDVLFPCKLIQLSYKEGEAVDKKITTFRSIKLNVENNENYRFN